jgi:hypothetical protein
MCFQYLSKYRSHSDFFLLFNVFETNYGFLNMIRIIIRLDIEINLGIFNDYIELNIVYIFFNIILI